MVRRVGGVVTRTVAVDRIVDAPPGTAVLVVAPAGYGKSTMVDAVRAALPGAAFVGLARQHDDGNRFTADLLRAVGAGELIETCPSIDTPAFVDLVVGALERPGGPQLVILDDVHEVTNPLVLEALAALVWRLRTGRMLLLSRRPPPIGAARLKVRRKLIEITDAGLALTSAEARNLVAEVSGRSDLSEAVDAEIERLRGWPAGLVLLGLALTRGENSMSELNLRTDLRDFIHSEVLSGLSADLREFLLELSIIGTFDAALATTASGRSNAADLLAELIARRLFVEYDRVHDGWMRFHDMFADVLRSEARALGVPRWQNIEVDTIDALMDRGEVDLAVARLQRITDPVVLARIIVDPANPSAPRRQVETLFERRDLSNVVNVFARVPVESLPGSLIVLFVSCGQALTNGDYPRARELHDVLARMPLPDAVLSAPEYVGLEALYQSLLGDVDASIDVVQRHLDARRDSSDLNL